MMPSDHATVACNRAHGDFDMSCVMSARQQSLLLALCADTTTSSRIQLATQLHDCTIAAAAAIAVELNHDCS
jgi:hypothetical protein